MARVQVLNETTLRDGDPSDWTLWFQWCRYLHDNGEVEYGYRCIWRRPESEGGSLQAARGQARIPSIAILERLIAQAKQEGWGHHDGDKETSEVEAAAGRLRKCGLIVDIESEFVGWPNPDAEKQAHEKGFLTQQMIDDAMLISGRPPPGAAVPWKNPNS